MWQKIAAQAAMAAATTASIEAVRLAPAVTKAAKKFYERVRDRKRKREQGRALGDAAPESNDFATTVQLTKLEERVDALETGEETQAELIAQMTEQQNPKPQ